MADMKWFSKWNRDNPTDVWGPAFLLGAVGSGVVLAALLIAWGQPYATQSDQTGPPGTGMSVVAFASDREEAQADLEEGEDPADLRVEGDWPETVAYENVQILGDLSQSEFIDLKEAITAWVAPEQGCTYCHSGEGDYSEAWAADDLYTKVVSRRMIQMTQFINDSYEHVQPAGVTCYTCHRGQNVPNGVWFQVERVTEATSGWSAVQNRATMQSGSTSLPSDALTQYLFNEEQINVHDLAPRVATQPGDPTWQNTERTFSLMNYFANSLGVNCTFCHNSRAFYDGQQVTPQWATASEGILMVQEINLEYLHPLGPLYPENRLGPSLVNSDEPNAPLAACSTCHQGQQQPLLGRDVISAWPALQFPSE